jgi:hypothetical protein
MIRKTALALAFTVAMTGTAFAQASVVGTYEYNGTDTDGSKYGEAGTLVVTQEASGAYQVKWDGGEYVGVGQVSGTVFAIAAVAEKKNTIMLLDIKPDGSLSGKWWRRNDAGSKGTETWTKK